MTSRAAALALVAGSILAAPAMTGCEALPGRPREQGAVAGAVVGGIIGGLAAGTPWVGTLVGAGIGLVGGWIIGFVVEEWFGWHGAPARAAIEAPMVPATPEQALAAQTADINGDGVVSLDELLAMHQAGLTEGEIIRRLEATDCIFELTQGQQDFLLSHGVSPRIVRTLPELNPHQRERLLAHLGDTER
jgi:MFS family permease